MLLEPPRIVDLSPGGRPASIVALMLAFVQSILGLLAVAGGLVFWIFSVYRASVDPELDSQARKVASVSLMFAPTLVVFYWVPKWLGRAPFLIDVDRAEG